VDHDFEMQVTTSGASGGAHQPDGIRLGHLIAHLHGYLLKVTV